MPYSGDPTTSDSDLVRFLIGDTNDDELLNDNEIEYCLTRASDVARTAAAFACEAILMKYYSKPDVKMGSFTEKPDRAFWERKIAEFSTATAVGYRVEPDQNRSFWRGQHDNPPTSNPDL
jgi:hypothetical protein